MAENDVMVRGARRRLSECLGHRMGRWTMSKRRLFLFAAIVYIGALVMTIPANQSYSRLSQWLPGMATLRLAQVSGSLWNGQAQQALIGGHYWQGLHWRYLPGALLTGKLGLALDARQQGLTVAMELRQGLMNPGLNEPVEIRQLQLDTRLAEPPLADLLPLPADGRLSMQLTELVIDPVRAPLALTRIEGRMTLKALQVTLASPQTIGDLSLTIRTDDNGRIHGQWRDSGSGPLAVSGEILIQPDGKYTLNSERQVRDSSQSGLLQIVRMLGTPGPDGRVRIRRQGDVIRDLAWARSMPSR